LIGLSGPRSSSSSSSIALTSAKLFGSSGGVKAGDVADLGDHEHRDVAPNAADLAEPTAAVTSESFR
jgi:hypothetical protein